MLALSFLKIKEISECRFGTALISGGIINKRVRYERNSIYCHLSKLYNGAAQFIVNVLNMLNLILFL